MAFNVAMKAICMIGGDRQYEQLHRGAHEKSIQVVQTAEKNTYHINTALSEAINGVLNDNELLQCLSADPG